MRYFVIYSIMVTLVTSSVWAQAKLLSLREAIQLALRHNRNIEKLELGRIIQKYDLRLAEREFEPRYSLTTSIGSVYGYQQTQNADGSSTFSGTTPSYSVTPGVSWKSPIGTTVQVSAPHGFDGRAFGPGVAVDVTQPLLRGMGRTVVQDRLMSAREREEINIMGLRDSISSTISSVVNNYRSLMQSNTNIETQKRSLEDAKRRIDHNLAKIEAGRMAPTDNVQSEAQYEKLKLALTEKINERDQALQTFLQLIGLQVDTKIKIPGEVVVPPPKVPDLERSIATALRNNTSYRNSVVALEQAKRRLRIAKNDQLWQLDLSAGASFNGKRRDLGRAYQDMAGARSYSNRVGLTLSIPVDDLSRKVGLISADIGLRTAELNLIEAKQDLITRVKNSVTNIKSTIEQMKQSKRSVELQQKAYDLTVIRQEVGRASSLDVSNVEDQVITARNALVSAKINHLRSVENLHSLMGTTLDHWQIKLKP